MYYDVEPYQCDYLRKPPRGEVAVAFFARDGEQTLQGLKVELVEENGDRKEIFDGWHV